MSACAEELWAKGQFAELADYANRLKRDLIAMRDKAARLQRQLDWLRIQQQATSPKPLPTEDTEHPEKPATTKHTKHTKGTP